MSAFAANLTGFQSSDGLTLTIQDLSNYGNNDSGYVIANFSTRNVILTDGFGTALSTLPLGSGLTVTYAMTKDLYINAQLVLAGVAPYTKTIQIPCDTITKEAYKVLLAQGCCSSKIVKERLASADIYLEGATISAPVLGGGADYQTDIQAAYAYLTN